MRKKTFRIADPIESAFLAQVEVRRLLPHETARCQQAVCENHYLQSADLVGEQLWYVAEVQGQWLALLGWSAAAYHLKGREAWIGWNETQRRARLSLLANNARFCLLTPAGAHPNLASYVMAQNLQRLSQDWQAAYGHPILAVESFVDTQLFRGTSYKATGWQAVGCTAGFKRVAQDFYQVHDRPKQLFVRELAKHAARTLRGRELPAALAGYERKVAPHCLMALDQAGSLWAVLQAQVPESRSVHGLRHKQATVLAIVFAYLLSGGRGGHRGVALFARDLSPTQRAAFRCWYNRKERRRRIAFIGCLKQCRCGPSSRRSGRGKKRAWAARMATWWCWMARRCGAAGARNWWAPSTRAADGRWESKRWPIRATRFLRAKRCCSGWTWTAPSR